MDYEMAPSRPGAKGDDPGPVRMLIVEDEDDQRNLLTALFEAQGYVVEATGDGLEAVRRIRQDCYDVAIVDYNLPGLDGLAAGNLVRNLIRNAVRPVMIALTATPDLLRDKENAALSVFDEIIAKSSNLAALVATVDRHLKSAPNAATRQAAVCTLPIVKAA
jgi:CheY-like chemotaxis protein